MEYADEYSPEDLTAAFAADEVARYQRMQHERGPDYAVLSLEDAEPDVDTLSPSDVDEAAFELAAERGMDPASVLDMVDALAGGERDTATRAYAVMQLAAMDDDTLALTVSAEKREKLADKGKGYALPDGAYPIADAKASGHRQNLLPARQIRRSSCQRRQGPYQQGRCQAGPAGAG